MLLSAVCVLVVAQSSSEIPEGLMNNPLCRVVMYSTGYSCQIIMKLENSRQIFEICSYLSNFIKIRPVGAKVFHTDGGTKRPDVANSRFPQFSESA